MAEETESSMSPSEGVGEPDLIDDSMLVLLMDIFLLLKFWLILVWLNGLLLGGSGTEYSFTVSLIAVVISSRLVYGKQTFKIGRASCRERVF